jgi:integrase
MPRKKNARPGVFQRGSTWYYRLSYVDEATGKYCQRWVGGFKNQTAAWNAKLDALARRNSGEDLRPDKITVAGYVNRWLRDYAAGLPGERTRGGYESLFRLHVEPAIGGVLLKKLRPLHIQGVYTRMREKGLSEKTILNCHRVLSEALRHAVDWEMLPRNPAASVKKPRPGRYEPVIMPIEMIRQALALVDDGTVGGAVVRFAIYSGMRQGELIRLRRDHIDLDGMRASIPKAKSRAGVRNLALTPDAATVLREQLKKRGEERLLCGPAYRNEGYVFARPDGAPLTPKACDWAWDRVRSKLGTRARFHDLRHAHASLLLQLGVHPKVVQERLGHASIQVTVDLYSHVMPGIHEAAVLPLDELLMPSAEAGKQLAQAKFGAGL